ncbi:MAG: response regulator, partial [Spirochaetes bacterium]|nr:response regulator [Spirochaetota bacterium]
RGEALRDKNGKAYRMSGSHSDITDRKEAEARMAAFSAVVENSDNIIVVKDLNLRVVATNNAFVRAAGKSDTEELIGKTDAQIFNVNPQTEPVKTYMDDDRQAQKLSYGEFIVREELVPGTDGRSLTVLTKKYPIFGNNGQLIGTGNISTDITERKRAEEESRNLSKMLSVLVKIASEYINITHDLVNEAINNSLNELGEFVKADRAYVFDYIWDKNICRNTYEWCRDGIPPQIDNLQDVSLDLISGWVGKHKDSETVFVPDAGMLPSDSYEKKMLKSQDVRSLVTQPIIRDGECIGFIGFDFVTGRHELTKDEVMLLQIFSQILVNINTRKELEHDLVHSKELALQASRAKSEFLANMSHEIRTPLNGIIGFTDLLSKTPLNGMQKQYCENVNTSGKSLLGIINDVLDFSKIEAGRLELDIIEVDLINLIEECADIIKYHADKKSLELIIEISPGIPRFAMFDPVRLKQIVTNLLSNSVKFTEKGEVHLELKFKQNDPGYGIYHFSVKDSGIGLTKDQQKKLFRAFSQADSSTTRKFGGTGLGLKISGELAIMMGSAISVRSVFGKGSTFSFAVKAKLGNNTKNVKPGLPVNKVLVVDDNFNSRRIIAENLKFWGVNSTQCDSGQGALDLLKEKSFDLLIIDQYMPQISGLRTVKTIRNILKISKENLPIIILHSASDGHELVDEIESLDISSSLIKPVKIDKLYKSIETINQNFDKNHDTIADNSYFEIAPLTVNIKILIAEDVEMNMALMKTLIGQMIPQAKITEAFNGKEAVEAVTNDEYDLVFMDVQMPEMDGLSATRKIRDLGYKSPIIALTAGAMDSGRKEALESGMNDFITKPVVADSLAVLLKQYLVKSERAETEQKAVDVKNEKATAKQGDGLKLNSVKQKIFDRTGQNEKLYYMLLEIGLRTIPQYLQKLDQAVARSSYPEIKIVSHSLKGALLNLAINDLAAIASEIQDLATLQSGITQIAALNRKLLVEWESIQTELQQ